MKQEINQVEVPERPLYLLESVEDVACRLSMKIAEPENSARLVSSREQAHRDGQCYGRLNGRQPIYTLLAYDDLRNLEGKLLTILDASFPDGRQGKAVKDLIRNAIWWDWLPNLDCDGPFG